MANQRKDKIVDKRKPNKREFAPALTDEDRENQLIVLAYDLVEQQLREGSASAQVLTHWIKRGSTREKLEELKLKRETELLQIKQEAIASQKRTEELYEKALSAMRTYSGQDDYEEDYLD